MIEISQTCVTLGKHSKSSAGSFASTGHSRFPRQVTQVFGRLLYEKRLGEEELGGLREDKLKSIRSFAKFLAEDTAA